jgi:hypothetical protein
MVVFSMEQGSSALSKLRNFWGGGCVPPPHMLLGARDFLFSKTAHSASYLMGTGWFSSWGVKQPGCEVDHMPPCSAEIKNERSYTSRHPVCHHGVNCEYHTSFLRFSHWCCWGFRSSGMWLCCWVSAPLCIKLVRCLFHGTQLTVYYIKI